MYYCLCGHSVEIKNKEPYKICSWCGRKVTRENESAQERSIKSYLKNKKLHERCGRNIKVNL